MSVDAHCHIDLHKDPDLVVKSAIEEGLKVVAVTTTPAAFKISSTFSNANAGILPSLGMHPEVVGERPADISLFGKYLDDVTWVGEVGLDGSRRFARSWEKQVEVFESVLRQCSDAGGKNLTIHSRAASEKVVQLLAKFPSAGTPVLHWYSGRIADMDQALRLGSYFSVNSQMLTSKSGMTIAKRIPLDRLLTESDSPFASASGSSIVLQIRECEDQLARLLGKDVTMIQKTVDANFSRLTELQDS